MANLTGDTPVRSHGLRLRRNNRTRTYPVSVTVTLPEPPAWTRDAACNGLACRDLDPWAPPEELPSAQRRFLIFQARLICSCCPVRLACARDALAELPLYGARTMRGGLTPDEQRQLARQLQLPTRKMAQHGTRARYVTGCHCDLCRQANKRDEHARRVRKVSARVEAS
jgi:hypothetical protein